MSENRSYLLERVLIVQTTNVKLVAIRPVHVVVPATRR
ncbi:hypothetical protein MPS_2266 [Mycobacterium pseudoshottsii JCM 15466]|uniref:Uncharacterized protein n=1 Tax=Mycobacterium ulcerans str. Harvey TaxID=1299332 RepID=A0ABP3A9I6_MYCUL|nr:hypothetical protein MMSP_1036 [Mycobacterium sp. 012931]EUA86920.1 hypothetical protein I551_6674 [Mycobacterium ulcerans str. Harvey]GAQ34748.1 hypothetical protein MPS_2266 [Mycobacterium pseudoshottsii JCM 15466]